MSVINRIFGGKANVAAIDCFVAEGRCTYPLDGRIYPTLIIDMQDDQSYHQDGPLDHLKTFIVHDGSKGGRYSARKMARNLLKTGRATLKNGERIIVVFPAMEHTVSISNGYTRG
jgi:hypothetical protein